MMNDEQRRKILETLVYRQKYEKFRQYIPNGKAESFIRMVGEGEQFISLFSAANGVGKTACGVNILCNILYPDNNPWFNFPIYKRFPYLKRGRIVSDPTTIKDQIVPELKYWFPRGRYEYQFGGKSYPRSWVTDTGFSFDLMTYDQDVKEFESVSLGFCWFDEPPPEAIYKATVSRMRRGGIIYITETPLIGSAWMYDSFITQAKEYD